MNPLIHQHKLRQALAICNRLPPSETKGRHASRLMTALNRVRPVAKRAGIGDKFDYACFVMSESVNEFCKSMEKVQWPQ